jgi:hypothetical protein
MRAIKSKAPAFLGCVAILYAALGALSAAPAQADEPPAISDINVRPQVFNPTGGQTTSIYYRLLRSADVSVRIFDSDHFLIATLQENRSSPAGANRVNWNGRDESGVVVPDEAYYFVIEAKDEDGRETTYDPTLFSGGEKLGVAPPVVDREETVVRYSLSKPARVRIRAGVHDGPLSKTILDWVPKLAGAHEEVWNGRDNSDAGVVWDHKRFLVVLSAFTLPENSIITVGSPVGYLDYWADAARKQGQELMALRLASEEGRKAHLKARKVRSDALQKRSGKIDSHYLTSRFMDRDPEFTLAVPDGVIEKRVDASVVQGEFEIEIKLTEGTKALLNEQRYEYVLYVDYVLWGERETGYSPYSWVLDTSRLNAGRHLITVNVATLSDQVGTASIWVDVER